MLIILYNNHHVNLEDQRMLQPFYSKPKYFAHRVASHKENRISDW